MNELKHACWLAMQFTLVRLILSRSAGRLDGAESAQRQIELCAFYAAVFNQADPETVRSTHEDSYDLLFSSTRRLCECLDESIGFDGTYAVDDDTETVAKRLFEKFHVSALALLDRK